MTIPYYVNEHNRIFGRSSLAGMGWRATASSRPVRFQTRGNASPESLRREAIFEHRPGWRRPLKCPECGGEHVRPCTRVDGYGRVWMDNSCETCGHKLSLEEIGRHIVN